MGIVGETVGIEGGDAKQTYFKGEKVRIENKKIDNVQWR